MNVQPNQEKEVRLLRTNIKKHFDNKHGYGTFVTFIIKAHWLGG